MLKKYLYQRRSRNLLIQILFVSLIALVLGMLINNAAENLKAQGIASGFGFLNETAGFAIIQSLIPYSEESTYFSVFLVGLLNTVLVSVIGIILSTFLGVFLGVARLSSNFLVSKTSEAYIEIVRNVPLLLQIFFWYFVVLRSLPHPRKSYSFFESVFINNRGMYFPAPEFVSAGFTYGLVIALFTAMIFFLSSRAKRLRVEKGQTSRNSVFVWPLFILVLGILYFTLGVPFKLDYPVLKGFNFTGGFTVIPEFLALLFSLVIYTAAFIGEIVRAGIQAVPRGQVEAAEALGLKKNVVLRKIVLPQALRVIIPPLTSQYLNLTKNSSLAAAIGYPELVSVFAGTVLNQTGQAVEVILITMGVYMTISLFISICMNIYNNKKALIER